MTIPYRVSEISTTENYEAKFKRVATYLFLIPFLALFSFVLWNTDIYWILLTEDTVPCLVAIAGGSFSLLFFMVSFLHLYQPCLAEGAYYTKVETLYKIALFTILPTTLLCAVPVVIKFAFQLSILTMEWKKNEMLIISFFIFVFFHKRAGMTYNGLEIVNKGFIFSDLGNKKERREKWNNGIEKHLIKYCPMHEHRLMKRWIPLNHLRNVNIGYRITSKLWITWNKNWKPNTKHTTKSERFTWKRYKE